MLSQFIYELHLHYNVRIKYFFSGAHSPHFTVFKTSFLPSEDTIAVSGNFVNRSNVAEFTRHLRINGLRDPRSRDLLQEHTRRIMDSVAGWPSQWFFLGILGF